MDHNQKINYHIIAIGHQELVRVKIAPYISSGVYCQWCFMKFNTLDLLHAHWGIHDEVCAREQVWHNIHTKEGTFFVYFHFLYNTSITRKLFYYTYLDGDYLFSNNYFEALDFIQKLAKHYQKVAPKANKSDVNQPDLTEPDLTELKIDDVEMQPTITRNESSSSIQHQQQRESNKPKFKIVYRDYHKEKEWDLIKQKIQQTQLDYDDDDDTSNIDPMINNISFQPEIAASRSQKKWDEWIVCTKFL